MSLGVGVIGTGVMGAEHVRILQEETRGAHLAEPDLLTLIRSGHIAGATLDVFRNEPLPQQHPFWQEPRITITPHISAATLRRESVAQIAAKMRRLHAGELVAGIVNRLQGY